MVLTVLLIRHAAREKNDTLVGWSPGVALTADGREQAKDLGARLAGVELAACYSSPLERCVETAQAILAGRKRPVLQLDEDLGELRAGGWEGKKLGTLAKTRQWMAVQFMPSLVRAPGGEALRDCQRRMLEAIEKIRMRHRGGVVCVVSHQDPIAMAVAWYLGLGFDLFQRIVIAPASVTALAFGSGPPRLLRLSDTGQYEAFASLKRVRKAKT